jgi:hypothetical protein
VLVLFCQSVHFAFQMLVFELDLAEFIGQYSIVLKYWNILFVRAFKVARRVTWHIAEGIFNIVRWKGDWCVEWFIQSIQVIKQCLDLLLKLRELNEVKAFFIFIAFSFRFEVLNDFEVDLLENDVEFVENLLFYLEKNVAWDLFYWRKRGRAAATLWYAHGLSIFVI